MFLPRSHFGRTMKKYSIYLVVDAMNTDEEAAFKASKKIFMKAVASDIESKKIIISKTQDILHAIELSIDEKYVIDIVNTFRALDIVYLIEAEYTGPSE